METKKEKSSLGVFTGLMLASIGLGLLAFLFASIPMIVTRRLYGLRVFLIANLGAAILMWCAGLAPFGLLYVVLTVLIAVFYQTRAAHLGIVRSGFVALGSGLGFSVLASAVYFKLHGISELVALKAQMKDFTQKLVEVSPQMRLDPEILWSQLPSVLALTFLASLVVAVTVEARLLDWLGAEAQEEIRPEDQLRNFKLPDALVWVSIAAVLGAFLELGRPVLKLVSLNLFYVMVFLFFLQGLAVAATYFDEFKVGAMWRSLWYFLMIVQLLLVVSLIGFSDYWLDFREKIMKKSAESKKGI